MAKDRRVDESQRHTGEGREDEGIGMDNDDYKGNCPIMVQIFF